METTPERRRRKLVALAKKHGGPRGIADDCDLSAATLDQIIKGSLLPKKADGKRSPRGLGDDLARRIEDHYKLGRGWFDADDLQQVPPPADASYALDAAFVTIAEAIEPATKLQRLALVPTFTTLAMEPELVHDVARQVRALLLPPPSPPPAPDNGSKSQPSGGPLPPTSRFPEPKADDKRSPVQSKGNRKR